jgi:metal-sulfur cluster biosynthetic enzyme
MTSVASPQKIAIAPFPYDGPEEFKAPVAAALGRVVDPELAMTIVDVGLIYGVTVRDDALRVRLTMTSAACPVADVIIDDVRHELSSVLPASVTIDTELVWEPEWTSDRMSERARKAMGW